MVVVISFKTRINLVPGTLLII